MLLNENLITYIRFMIGSGDFRGRYFPFKFRPDSENLVVKEPRKIFGIRQEHVKIVIYAFYVFSLPSQLLYEGSSVPIVTSLISLLFAIAGLTFWFTKTVAFHCRENLVELFNLFIQFEKRHLQGKKKIKVASKFSK